MSILSVHDLQGIPAYNNKIRVPSGHQLDFEGTLKIPLWTTSTRPQSPEAGLIGYNTEASSLEFYDGTIWIDLGGGANDGSTPERAAASAAEILQLNPSAPDGLYWIKPNGGSGVAFRTYCIMQRYGGGWMKVLQYKDGTNMTGEDPINAGGSWINSEINANQPGKISNTDFNALLGNEFLVRVINGGDNFLNNGQGTGKFTYSVALPNWGTALDPTGSYSWSLDATSDGSFDYKANYTNDTRGLCNHSTNIWINDHNYNGSFEGTTPPYNSIPICWTFAPTGLYTNLHWMSGQSSQSGGSITWGLAGNSTAASIFIK